MSSGDILRLATLALREQQTAAERDAALAEIEKLRAQLAEQK